jgi:uncharacterized protein (DUF2225 family)
VRGKKKSAKNTGDGPMTKLQLIELCCPVCDNHFRSRAMEAQESPAGKRTDFHEQWPGRTPLPYLVHMCDRCGLSGAERDFTEGPELSAVVIDHVWNELAPRVAENSGAASEKYEAAAKVAEWREADSRQAADLWLRAAWCCVEEEDVEAERFFRLKAARRFEAALSAFDDVPREDRARLTYLTGELWRRIGDLRQARAWFDRVACEVVDVESQQWIINAAHQQRDCPREYFG